MFAGVDMTLPVRRWMTSALLEQFKEKYTYHKYTYHNNNGEDLHLQL